LGQPDGGCEPWSSPKFPSCRHGGPGIVEEAGAEEAKKEKMNEAYFRFYRQAFCFPPPCSLEQLDCQIKACKKYL
jgi:hypothetical protein